jgi:hypothetical protein
MSGERARRFPDPGGRRDRLSPQASPDDPPRPNLQHHWTAMAFNMRLQSGSRSPHDQEGADDAASEVPRNGRTAMRDLNEEEDNAQREGRYRQDFSSVMGASYDIKRTTPFDDAYKPKPSRLREIQETPDAHSVSWSLGGESLAIAAAGQSSLASSIAAMPACERTVSPRPAPAHRGSRGRGGYGNGRRGRPVDQSLPQALHPEGSGGGSRATAVQGASSGSERPNAYADVGH